MDDMNNNSEANFSYSYDEFNDNSNDSNFTGKNKKGGFKVFLIILLVILVIGSLAFFGINLMKKMRSSEINLVVPYSIDIEVGDSKKIDVKIKGTNDKKPNIIYASQDDNIATISVDGMVTGISDGSTTIAVIYNAKDGKSYNKNCIVSVSKKDDPTKPENPPKVDPGDNTGPTIKYNVPNAQNGWYKGSVAIDVSAEDEDGVKSIKYTLNCTNNCQYTDISGSRKIALSKNGTNVVMVTATDNKGNATTKEITVKIDSTKPTVKLDIKDNVVYNTTGSVKVCAICTDTGSGCLEEKVCQTHTQNIEKATLIVYDKAGNYTVSPSYKIVNDKGDTVTDTIKPTCSLSYANKKITAVSSDTGGSGLVYYGFNEKYTGANVEEKSEITEGTYNYYVKDGAGNTNTCSLNCSFGIWFKSGYKTPGECHAYSRTEAERTGSTWYRECPGGKTGEPVEYTRILSCK